MYYISRDQQMMVDDLFAPLYTVFSQAEHPSLQLRQLWQRVIFRWAGAYQSAPHRAKFPVHISVVQALVEQIDDAYERAVGQYCLGWYFTATNDMPSSQAHLRISDALLAQLDEKYLRSIVLARLGFIEIVNGNQDAFRTYAEHSVKLTEELGVSIQRFAPLNNLGAVAFFLGDYEEARRRFYETSVLISQSRYYTMVFPFSNLALIDFITGDFEASQRMLTKIDKLVGSSFSTSGYGLALAVKGMLLTTQGRYVESLEAGQRSFDYASNVSVRFSSRLALAMAYVGLSDFEKAQQVLLESLNFLHPVENYRGVIYLSIPMLAAIRHHWGQSYIATEYLSMAFHHLPKSQSFIHKWRYIDELKQVLRMTLSPTDFERAWTDGQSLELTAIIQDFLNDVGHAQETTE
jgi:tetratricopeptide (TPR) repeat protein